MSVVRSCLDFSAGDPRLLAPSATHRSWVNAGGDGDVSELTKTSIERAPGAPMSELYMTLFLQSRRVLLPPQHPR
jgi:hypothetical protein